jgi:hypothetical protein
MPSKAELDNYKEMDKYDLQEPEPEPHYFDTNPVPQSIVVKNNTVPFEDAGPSLEDSLVVPAPSTDPYQGTSKL